MSVSNLRHRSPGREHFVRQVVHRDVNHAQLVGARAESTAEVTTSSSTVPASAADPASVKALIAFVVILGVALIGVFAWRIGVWRRRKFREASKGPRVVVTADNGNIGSKSFDFGLSQDEKIGDLEAYMLPNPLPAVHSPDKSIRKATNRFIGSWSSRKSVSPTTAQQQLLPTVHEQSPLPSQTATLASFKSPTSSTKATLGTQLKAVKLHLVGSPDRPVTPVASLTLDKLTEAMPHSPVPSPRTTSHGPDSPLYKAVAANRPRSRSLNGKKLPRLMTVVHTFVPTLADELGIQLGETLRLLEEYEDEWCLVQRCGRHDAEKGVIPRFCLQERAEVIGSLPRHKKSMSTIYYVHSARP